MFLEKPGEDFRYLRYTPLLCIGTLLFFTFRLYGYAYFWTDDFNCLSQVQTQSGFQMLGHLANPASGFFRPLGMLFYWVGFRLFDRNPYLFHCLLWTIHAANTFLVYVLLKRLTQSRAGASVGAMLFASQPLFNDVFWNFGDIFEVTGQALFLTGILVWTRRRSLPNVLLASAVFLLALKAKETAIVLPAIWLAYDLLLRDGSRKTEWKTFAYLLAPALLGAWYGWRKMLAMGSSDRSHPYFMDLTWRTLARGYGGYFSMLLNVNWRWQIWAIGFVAVLLMFLIRRERPALFFQLYVFIAFLPVIFLVNHRDPVYWYFPMIGVCGLAACVVRYLTSDKMLERIPRRALVPVAFSLFALMSYGTYVFTRNATATRRSWQQGLASEYAGFVTSLQALNPSAPGQPIYFTSMPRLFDATVLRDATAIALLQPEIATRLVDQCPADAMSCYRFADARLSPTH